MKKQRYDKSVILDYRETPEGYLTVTVPITRPGVFPYQRNDGTVQMEAKLPEDLFSDSTISTACSKPITDDHPNEPVTADNYSRYAKGMSHTDAKVKDFKLYVSLTITDKSLIQKIHDGKREISIGFLSDVVAESGTYKGMNYEFVQRNIEINHIAIVDEGRAGPEVGIRNDSAAAYQIDAAETNTPAFQVGDRIQVNIANPHMPGQSGGEVREAVLTWVYGIIFDGMEDMGIHKWYVEDELKAENASKQTNGKKKMPGMDKKGVVKMPIYKIDGQEYEVDSAVKSFLDAQLARLDAANIKVKEFDALQGSYDATEAKLKKAETDLDEAKKQNLSADELNKKVQARVELVANASKYLGDSFDFIGKTDREVKEAVILKANPDFKGDGKSDEYIDAFFDATVDRVKADGFSSTGANALLTGDGKQTTSLDAKRQARLNIKNQKQ